ncbi:MAG: precorrin-6y C5,15-methyltransferase (decarboxylating) subunit CbiE [Actinobacteria bacterium]|nr:precorrin-6y C5,15-methyltransferase (decarboxylating) subunit CbiE [Actinomycetota bacterium]
MFHIVGVGAEGPLSLTPQAREIIDRAEVLVGGKRLLAMFPGKGEQIVLGADPAAVIERLAGEKRRVVALASGDPGFFGIARRLVERLGKDNVEILPNVSSMQLAFARLKESWDDATSISVHGRPLDDLAEQVQRQRKVAILTDNMNTPAALGRQLAKSAGDDYDAYLCENLGGAEEKVQRLTLEELTGAEADPLSIVVLIKKDGAQPADKMAWPHGIPEREFHHRGGLITKAEVRLATLAKLRLRETSVVWDIGAGCGSVSIEAALIAREGQVHAVERDPEQVELIRANLAKFKVNNVTVVHGHAPEALEGLPQPDAVFIGGSSGKLAAIFDVVDRQLQPEGTVVVNAASLETAGAAIAGLRQRSYDVESTLMQVSRGKELGGLTHFEALDPVFIISARKPVG